MELGLGSLVGSFPLFLPGMMFMNPRNLVVYSRKLDVINRGLSGYNTEWAIPVFDQVSWTGFVDQSVRKG